MQQDRPKLYDLVLPGRPASLVPELKLLGSLMDPGFQGGLLERACHDTALLYGGGYPGYRASNTRYHDLEHASAVALAMMRLMHGASTQGYSFDRRRIDVAVMAALFHDSGLIQAADDTEGTGAKYTVGHERRSMDFARRYFASSGLAPEDAEDCCQIIAATQLSVDLDGLPWRDDQVRFLGQILGTADMLAQMADRQYLEKLLLLYREFEEARLPGFDDELTLLKRTEGFYRRMAKARLAGEYGDAQRFMRHHFRARWRLDVDLYADAIANNLAYLRHVVEQSEGCSHREFLRRGGIVEGLDSHGCPDPRRD